MSFFLIDQTYARHLATDVNKNCKVFSRATTSTVCQFESGLKLARGSSRETRNERIDRAEETQPAELTGKINFSAVNFLGDISDRIRKSLPGAPSNETSKTANKMPIKFCRHVPYAQNKKYYRRCIFFFRSSSSRLFRIDHFAFALPLRIQFNF